MTGNQDSPVPDASKNIGTSDRESMHYDLLIVGAGPAGLACACRYKQLQPDASVCVLEKGSEVGAHILSGAIFETAALDELFPNWRELKAPLNTTVTRDEIYWLRSDHSSIKIPAFFTPNTMKNHGNYIISLGELCRWLANQAESLGVDIFPGFAASEILYDADGVVAGVATGDMGRDKKGSAKDGFQQGMALYAHYTVFSEGCRGHLGKQLISNFHLDKDKTPQHYALGIKELWRVPAAQAQAGLVVHTAGWPLDESRSHGGSFLYHLNNGLVAVGLVVDLAYENCNLNPFEEFQRHKHHPVIARHLKGAERLSYGARSICKGGLQSQPKLSFPGGMLAGDDAGTLNFAKIKGTHTAMKSGMCAAEAAAEAIANDQFKLDLKTYQTRYTKSWAYKELYSQRNFGPAMSKWGNLLGSIYAFFDINIFSGKLPWTLADNTVDYARLKRHGSSKKITYPKPDNVLSFDRLSSVFLSNTNHEEDQPCHLMLADIKIPTGKNLQDFNEPAQRYCPAGVYEIINAGTDTDRKAEQTPTLIINAQNCLHCKACDIKDPAQNITWTSPEGGGGPNYPNM